MKLYIVPFTRIQEEIRNACPEEYFTLIMRRFMMRLAQRVARDENCGALITGESVAQVASQTIPALAVTDALATMPVFRPVIGMDKEEIVAIARKIDTFELSIQPYEDCCTVFTPRHPCTRPKVVKVAEAESVLDIDTLVEDAMAGIRILDI
jgi:thiamine biosynthesis protein ThiI